VGSGLQTALALAGAGAHVVSLRVTRRRRRRGERDPVSHPVGVVEVVPLDLGDLSSVAAAARTVLAGTSAWTCW
jgi:NAD(P)-dependent dehydrogenase (short-subunit alcohol dehydrogenase family)